MAEEDLSEFESRLLAWLIHSDFVKVGWSTKRAAKDFETDEDAIREAIVAIARKVPNKIQITYKDGSIRIAAE